MNAKLAIIDKLTQLAVMIAYNYDDLKEEVKKFTFLKFLTKCVDPTLSESIRLKSLLCISTLTY